MLATSPIASFSTSVSSSPGSADAESPDVALLPELEDKSIPLKSAFISSWDNIPLSMYLLLLSDYAGHPYCIIFLAGTGHRCKFLNISYIYFQFAVHTSAQSNHIIHL